MIRFDEKLQNFVEGAQTKSDGAPFLVTVRLLKRCTAKCLMCDFWKENSKSMPLEGAMHIVEECARRGVKEICFTGGEPTSYEHFFEVAQMVKSEGMDYSFITNGSLLTREFVEKIMKFPPARIFVSIDSPKSKVHDYMRGVEGLFERAIFGLEEFNRYAFRPKIIVNCVISNNNYLDIPKLIEYGGERIFDEINLMQIKGMPNWSLTKEQILEYNTSIAPQILSAAEERGVLIRSGSPYIFGFSEKEIIQSTSGIYSKEFYKKNKCSITQSMLFVEVNGDVFPCNNTPYYGESFLCGNIFEQTIPQILSSKKFAKVRENFCGGKLCIGCDPINREINESNALRSSLPRLSCKGVLV